MSEVECPYCHHDNEEPHPDYWEASTTFKFTCEKCEKEFMVLVEFYPFFHSYKKEENVAV